MKMLLKTIIEAQRSQVARHLLHNLLRYRRLARRWGHNWGHNAKSELGKTS